MAIRFFGLRRRILQNYSTPSVAANKIMRYLERTTRFINEFYQVNTVLFSKASTSEPYTLAVGILTQHILVGKSYKPVFFGEKNKALSELKTY